MFEAVPIRAWLVLGIAFVAFAPARYVFEHVLHDPRRRDITRPPEDLGWRSSRQLLLSGAALAGLAALAVFIFTPAAERFAHSRSFWPALLAVFGTFACGTVVRGLANGRIEPLVRGVSSTYERATQPKRFWASMAWNAALGAGLLVGGTHGTTMWERDTCFDPRGGAETAQARIEACDALLANATDDEQRALALAERGIGHDWIGDDQQAIADYSESLRLAPSDANTLYNRARLYARTGDPRRAIADYDASLALQPNNRNALFNRGLILLDTGLPEKSVPDFTRAHALDPADPWPLANRGLAHAWTDERALAEADFAAVRAIDPTNQVMLHGEAVLAMRAEDFRSAIASLSEALRHDPNDMWALRMRGDAYWQIGEQQKAQDDDDRLAPLLEAERKARAAAG